MHTNHAQAVEQILAELSFGDPLFEIRVRGGDDPNIDLLGPRFADRQHFTLLEKPEQFRLDVDGQVADFIEEQRAADRGPQDAGLIRHRARKAAAPMAKELTVSQFARRARAVVGQEHAAASKRSGMNRPSHEVLARATLAGNEDRQIVALEALNLICDALHRGAGADEPGEERLQLTFHYRCRGLDRPFARLAQVESLPKDSTNMRKRWP